jgi:2-dehydropantoate 2-reductase
LKIVVYGAGAIGSLFGAFLARENEVTLVGREEHVSTVQEKGLIVKGRNEFSSKPNAVTSQEECEIPDLLVITVKSYDTEAAVREACPLIGESTTVMSLQNGLGNLEVTKEILGDVTIIGGVTSHGAVLRRPGVVEHTGIGDTTVGMFTGLGDAGELANLLSANGIQTSLSNDITVDIWYKALVNAAINPLATLASSPKGVLLEDEGLRTLAGEIVAEGVSVANAHGIMLDEERAFSNVMKVAEQTAENRNSMLQDLERGKRTEIDQINGAITRLGAEEGVETPVNIGLLFQIKYIEKMA